MSHPYSFLVTCSKSCTGLHHNLELVRVFLLHVVPLISLRELVTFPLDIILYHHKMIWLLSVCFPAAATAAKLLQSCPTLCDPIDGSPPGSPVPGILQARTLEWAAIAFSNAWKWKVKGKLLSRARLLATPWTVAYQAPQSMGFSRQEYWSGVPLPSPVCFPKLWQIYFESLYPLPSAVSGIEMWLNQYLMNWVEHKK